MRIQPINPLKPILSQNKTTWQCRKGSSFVHHLCVQMSQEMPSLAGLASSTSLTALAGSSSLTGLAGSTSLTVAGATSLTGPGRPTGTEVLDLLKRLVGDVDKLSAQQETFDCALHNLAHEKMSKTAFLTVVSNAIDATNTLNGAVWYGVYENTVVCSPLLLRMMGGGFGYDLEALIHWLKKAGAIIFTPDQPVLFLPYIPPDNLSGYYQIPLERFFALVTSCKATAPEGAVATDPQTLYKRALLDPAVYKAPNLSDWQVAFGQFFFCFTLRIHKHCR